MPVLRVRGCRTLCAFCKGCGFSLGLVCPLATKNPVLPRAYFPLLVALSFRFAPAQQQPATQQKPKHKSDQLLTTDPIALLAVKRQAGEARPAGAAAPAVALPTDETSRKAALATIDKQIKDKQDQIILLMRWFVDDEQKFVIDPTNSQVDPSTKERRKYEQVAYETAELAKLKAKRELFAAGQ
jgi:hypothetical protein